MNPADPPGSNPIRVRLLESSDLDFADQVRALAGWNQTRSDWERMRKLEPHGCYLAEHNGCPAGVATTLVHSPNLAWIGMLLVHPHHRNHGVGQTLLSTCVNHLQQRDIRCIKLDATPLGKRIYDRAGFRPEWTLSRWEASRPDLAARPPLPDLDLSPVSRASDLDSLDAAAFGVARVRLLPLLLQAGAQAWIARDPSGTPLGYGLLRPGAKAAYLGPVVALVPTAGQALVSHLLHQAHPSQPGVFWDIPDPNRPAVALAQTLGFIRQRPLTRMALGPDPAPGHPKLQWGIAGPDLG